MLRSLVHGVRRLAGGAPEPCRRGARVRTRVQMPAVVDVPVDVLRILRGLDDTLDLYVLPALADVADDDDFSIHGPRVWMLLKNDKPSRIDAGRLELAEARREHDQDEPLYSAHLMAQGFELLGEYDYRHGTSAGYLTAQAQRKLYATEAQLRATMQRRREEADGTEHKRRARGVMRDRVISGAAQDWARAFKGRRVFSQTR